MAESRKTSGKRKRAQHPLRILLRWCRITILLLIALPIGLLLWANLFGLPRWVSVEVQKELHRRSIHVEFAKLRLKGFRHLVARDVRFQRTPMTNSPSFTAREAEFLIDHQQLRNGNLQLSGVRIVSGELQLPLDSNTDRTLIVSNITADILLLPGDTLQVANLSAETLGARASLSGELKQFSKFRFASTGPKPTADWQGPLKQVLDIAEQLQFVRPPELSVSLVADGSDVPATRAAVTLRSDEATSHWGKFDHLEVSSSIVPAGTNNAVRGQFLSTVSAFRTEWGSLGSLQIEGETIWSRDMELLLTNLVRLRAENIDSQWFRSAQAEAALTSTQDSTNSLIRSRLEASTDAIEAPGLAARTNSLEAAFEHPLPFPTPAAWLAQLFTGKQAETAHDASNPLTGAWRANSSRLKSSRMDLDSIEIRGGLTVATNRSEDPNIGAWRFLAPLQVPWEAQVTNILAGEVAIGALQARGVWDFPRLNIETFDAQLHGGVLKATADLDVHTRRVSGSLQSKFQYQKMAVLLEKPVQQWIEQFAWEEPPFIESTFTFRMPPWTNWSARLKAEVPASLELAGRFEGKGESRGIPVDHAASHFHFSNFVWTLPDLVIRRPEGEARIHYTGNVTNADFACTIESRIDPSVLRPLLPKDQQVAMEIVKFARPPLIHADLRGNLDDNSSLVLRASIAGTNFFVKEQAFTDISGGLLMTNGTIICTNVIAHRGTEEARAPYLRIDIPGEVMFVTNLVSTIDPYIAMSLVGEDAYNAIDPYRFASRPTVGVNGIVPLRHWSKADLHFDVVGEEFSFWRFHMPNLAGHVHWRSNVVTFSNVVANFYGGHARWSGHFAIDPRKGEDYALFSFAGYTVNADLNTLVADITRRTNQMEGVLHGELIITSASTANDHSWNGYGQATIQDGFLWNVPIFGVFSPILDGIAPGLGSSRITSGNGTFAIKDSVVHTRDMQVRAPAFRLAYKGQVDLEGNLDATAEAMLLRDTWVVGKLFSAALWPVSKVFEAKISGNLDAPKTQLRYVPKLLLAPFRVLGAIGNAARGKNQPENVLQSPAGGTNAPAPPLRP